MNTWTISLDQVAPIPISHEVKQYDQKNDSITSILCDICDALSEEGGIRFLVGGFGQERWPVDVRTDLAVVVEQLPAALDALRTEEPATLGFYEQGIQRLLILTPSGTQTIVECQSMTAWQPNPGVIRMDTMDLLKMLAAFFDAFVEKTRQCCPGVVQHPWFLEWLGHKSG